MRFFTLCAVLLLTASFVLAQQNKPNPVAGVNTTAQSFTATTLEGKTYKLEDLKGKIVVLNFWSTKCWACGEEISELNKLVDTYKNGNEVVFLGFAHQAKPQVEQFLKKNPFKYQIVPAGLQEMIVPYGIPLGNGFFDIEFPTHILINREGIIEVYQGGIKGAKAVRAKLEAIFKNEAAKSKIAE